MGDVFRVRAFNRELTVLAGIEANKQMGVEKRELYTSEINWRAFTEKAKCPHLLIGVDGECHSYQRKLLKPYFAKSALADRIPMMREIVERDVLGFDGQNVSINPWLKNLMSNQVGYVMQGIEATLEETNAFMFSQNTILNVYMFKRWPKLALLNPRYIRAKKISDDFQNKLLAQNSANKEKPFETYTDKVEEGRKEKPAWFTDGDFEAHAMLPYVGGVDTAGGTHSFILYEMLNHPELMPRLRDEVDATYANGPLDLEAIEGMDDLRGFLYECMRLHPTGFTLNRNAAENFEFGGYRIRKGDELLVYTTATHMDGRYFPEPEKFDIERYRHPRNEHRQRHVYTPFGRGPHTCVAATLAEQQLMVNFATLLRYMDIEPAVPLDKLKKTYSPVAFMSDNFTVTFMKRAISGLTQKRGK
jgi:cytochrome P450